MKSKIILMICGMLFVASAALAATVDPSDSNAGKTVLGDGKSLGKLSASVRLGANHDGTGYAVTTSHKSGSKTFGTSHNATSIYAKDGLEAGAPSASDSSAFSSGWTAM